MTTSKQIEAFVDKYVKPASQPNALPEMYAIVRKARQEIMDDLFNNK